MANLDAHELKHFGKKGLPIFPIILVVLIIGIIFVSLQDIEPEVKPVVKIIEHAALK